MSPSVTYRHGEFLCFAATGIGRNIDNEYAAIPAAIFGGNRNRARSAPINS